MGLLKSRKFWTTLVGTAVCIFAFVGLKLVGIDDDTAMKLTLSIAGFFGLTLSGQIILDLASLLKGLQKPK